MSGEFVGCFGLIELDVGLDLVGMCMWVEKIDGGYKLIGLKMWIFNLLIVDVFVVWVKLEVYDGVICGFVLEKGMKGFSVLKIGGKLLLCVFIIGEIVMDNVEVGEDVLLLNVFGFKGLFGCFNWVCYGIVWGFMGVVEDCWIWVW